MNVTSVNIYGPFKFHSSRQNPSTARAKAQLNEMGFSLSQGVVFNFEVLQAIHLLYEAYGRYRGALANLDNYGRQKGMSAGPSDANLKDLRREFADAKRGLKLAIGEFRRRVGPGWGLFGAPDFFS